MTSILTNFAANTALLNLENTNNQLQNIQNQISTGLRVSSAADNAAYFSIATVMRSDSSALSTVSDQLNLGGSSLGVATTALSQISTTLSDIKQQLLSATTAGVDRTAIQEKISQDETQLKNTANSASFNGQNFLSVDSSATNYNASKSFISSFSRDASGNVTVGTISVNVQANALFDAAGGYSNAMAANNISTSLMSSTASAALTNGLGNTATNQFTATNTDGSLQIQSFTGDVGTLNTGTYGKYYQNTITIANVGTTGGAPVVTETAGTSANGFGDLAAPSGNDKVGSISTDAAFANSVSDLNVDLTPQYSSANHTLTFYVLENDSTNAGKYSYNEYQVSNFNPTVGDGILDTNDTSTTGTYTPTNADGTQGTPVSSATAQTSTAWAANGGPTAGAHANGTGVSIENINIAGATDSQGDMAYLNALVNQVDKAITSVAASSAAYGTAQARITTQSSFISSLQTSLNDGIGSLVDADLNVASTRLQALQVQQQLGVQSLSIANQSTQAVLKLFQ